MPWCSRVSVVGRLTLVMLLEATTTTTDPFALPAFILSIVGLSVAIIGALTGIVSLVWQIITRTRGAHSIIVKVDAGMMITGREHDYGELILVTAINRGASAVQVVSWGVLDRKRKMGFVIFMPLPESTPLPHMLQPGTSARFISRSADLGDALRDAGFSSSAGLRAYVDLATGQRIFAKGRIELDDILLR